MSDTASESTTMYFIADIGTTTIKASLCSFQGPSRASEGIIVPEPSATVSEKNTQSVFGLDVVSRVLYAHHNGVKPLQQKVCNQLYSMLCALCERERIMLEKLSGMIITGNTIMLHLVRVLSVQGFEMAPFTPVTLESSELSFKELLPESDLDVPVFFPPCIDAFIGADAVCAALSVIEGGLSFTGQPRFPLLIADVGTNTEIMLISSADDHKITCCSTAAGPAFEGGVLGGRYTGSSLVHLLAELLKAGAMDETGLLDEKAAEQVCRTGTFIAPGVFQSQLLEPRKDLPVITQDAVRQLQLAKGAVCAAIETLLKEEGLTVDEVGQFVLCGNFGSALDVKEAEFIGLFPAGLASVTEYAGNAAELGARLLMKDEMREKAKKIAASGKLIQLADSSWFARRYIERMNFGN